MAQVCLSFGGVSLRKADEFHYCLSLYTSATLYVCFYTYGLLRPHVRVHPVPSSLRPHMSTTLRALPSILTRLGHGISFFMVPRVCAVGPYDSV